MIGLAILLLLAVLVLVVVSGVWVKKPAVKVLLNLLGFIILAVLGAWLLWEATYPTTSHRYRLTLEVETPAGLATGSSVIEVTQKRQLPIGGAPALLYFVRGEAVFVDLGGGRHVIAILGHGPNGADDRIAGLAHSAFGRLHKGLRLEDMGKLTGTAPVPGGLLPTLVTFGDLNDPKSARVVRPEEFEQVFGEGVRLRRAFVEMTADPVTRGIEGKMPWLPHPRYLSGQFACGPKEPHCLHGGHFTR
jgi:hypothetical protein